MRQRRRRGQPHHLFIVRGSARRRRPTRARRRGSPRSLVPVDVVGAGATGLDEKVQVLGQCGDGGGDVFDGHGLAVEQHSLP